MDEAKIAELVGNACDEVLTSLDGVTNVDWNDLGEVTIATEHGTYRGTFLLLVDDQ